MSITDDERFEEVLRMKNEPLVLDEREAARFDALCKERSPRLAKPLPIEDPSATRVEDPEERTER